MSWLLVAFTGYALLAVASISDKFLLSERRIGAPALYAFFTALTSLPFLALVPFGFVFFIPTAIAFGTFSGFLFLFGLLSSYRAIKRSEVSRVAPLVGVATTGFLFALSAFSSFSSGGSVAPVDVLSLALLVSGGVLLATGGKGIRGPGFTRDVLVSGALFAASYIMLKESYLLSDFATGFVWSKLGMFLGGIALLLLPSSRRSILSGQERFSGSAKRTVGTAAFFLLNQGFGGAGTILVSYAVSLGPATFIQGMNGAQYGLVFLLAMTLSIRFPSIFREHISRSGMLRKCFAIILLSLGIWLIAYGGSTDGFL
ncbi:MAG: hypothetical protein HGA31_00610 [Candidatus Moranbacteria bacterium]|nr:hypothetical protein [Candidatus Moranbacteria bacterium]